MPDGTNCAQRPEKPRYRFAGHLSSAFDPLRSAKAWLTWKYVWNDKASKYDKPPCDARSGKVCGATDPAHWGTFEEARQTAKRCNMAGVGLVIHAGDNLTGVDLDNCRNPVTGELSDLAKEMVAYAESYAEVSPSGKGIRILVLDKLAKSMKDDSVGVELYVDGRYLTITGHHIPGTPDEIRSGPRTIDRLVSVVEAARERRKRTASGKREQAQSSGSSFFQEVNREALAALDEWVSELLPRARKQATGGWRVSSAELGRKFQEDLSIHPSGIQDFGPETGLTPIDLVIEHGRHADAVAAALWLCERMGIDPTSLGWKSEAKYSSRNSNNSSGYGHNSGAASEEPIPLLRDAPPATEFPVAAMGPIMANATQAFHEEIQAPMALCGNSVLAAATLAVQQSFDVRLPHGGQSPTSSYFATVAQSGERKSAVDAKVLKPVREHEGELRRDHETERRDYLDHKESYDACRKRTLSAKTTMAAKRQELKDLGPAPIPPARPIRAVSDVTSEGLFGLLEYVPSAAVFASEGGQFTGGHGMSDDSKLRNAAYFSLMWDRGSADRVRAKEEPKVLTGRRLSVHILVQPQVAFRFFTDPILKDQGLLSRFLMAYPDSRMGERRYVRQIGLEHVTAQVRLGARIKELMQLKPRTKEGDPFALDPKALPLSDEATDLFIRMVDEIEAELGPHGHLRSISGLANKLPEHAARLAAVRTIIDDPAATEIDAEAMQGGIQLALYFASEARRIAMMSEGQVELHEGKALWEWLEKKWEHEYISITDLQQRGPNFIRDKEKAEELAKLLEEHGYLRSAGPQTIGDKKRRQTWQIWRAA
jgi:hypothetical protein